MPSIIPALPQPWPASPTSSTTIDIGSGYTVTSGTVLYTSGMVWVPGTRSAFTTTTDTGTLINNGTVWVREVDDVGFRWGRSGGDVINNGLVVVESTAGRAYGIYDSLDLGSGSGTLQNNGQLFVFGHIYAVGLAGRRFGLATYRNDGLIAVRCDAGEAIGFQFGNGNDNAFNSASGQILVEGVSAIGVDIAGRNNFSNLGTITARTIANPVSGQIENYSIGIAAYIFPSGIGQSGTINNSGTITADIAIRAYSLTGYSNLHNFITVNNLAGGVLNGAVILEFTDDVFTNVGAVNGLVDMREGNDVLDTTAGTINGLIDMGFGDDRFEGSAGADYVLGSKGADILNGAGGADLLLGGSGNDRIAGGAGNDGLYGELGDDLIISQGGDEIFGGDGNDRIELGDLQFYSVSGGNGSDTLVLPNGTFSLNWHQLVSSGLVAGIEQLVMRGNQEIGLAAADMAGLVNQTLLVNTAGISDKLDLVGGWIEGATQTVGGVIYRSFSLSGSTVLVSGGGTVAVMATMPAGLAGLDPYVGKPPPLPGAIPGAELSSNVWISSEYEPGTNITIDRGETWMADPDTGGSAFFIYDNIEFRNDGLLLATNSGQLLNIGFIWSVTNTGTMRATVTGGGSHAIEIEQHGVVINTGSIEVDASGPAFAIVSWGGDRQVVVNPVETITIPTLENHGTISVVSHEGNAWGADLINGSTIINSGVIDVSGKDWAIGLQVGGFFERLDNSGTISASVSPSAVGQSFGLRIGTVLFNARVSPTITNSGVIEATTAIHLTGFQDISPPPPPGFPPFPAFPLPTLTINNTNRITGNVELISTTDVFTNTGLVEGTVLLGIGNDRFDTRSGTFIGTAFGQEGNDTLLGGAGTDWFSGGAGDDTIDGGGGIDRAIYDDAGAGVTVDLRISAAQNTVGAGIDTLSNIEGLVGSAFADTLTGNASANYLDGGADNDLLTGGGGDDRIIGGDGQDDVAVYSGARASYLVEEVTIDGVRHFRVTGQGGAAGDGVDLLSGVEILRFSDQDLRIGNYRPVLGATVIPDQSAGDGSLYSYQIPATAFFDGNGDPLSYTVTLADGSPLPAWLSFNAATRTLSGTPPLAAVGLQLDIRITASDNAPGDPASQISDTFTLAITQAAGADIYGTPGVDALNGTFRSERMIGLDGNDTFAGSAGADFIDGGAGADTADYSLSVGSVSVDLAGVGSGGDAEGDTWASIEIVRGSFFGHDTLRGTDAAETLLGLGGNDGLFGGGGDDILDGGAGSNFVFGEAGNDRLLLGSEIDSSGMWSIYDGGADSDTLVVTGAVSTFMIEYHNLEAIELTPGAALTLNGFQFSTGFAANSSIGGTGNLTVNMSDGYYFFATLMNVASTVALTVNGTAGVDVIKGALGAAFAVNAGDGADQIRGGNLADTILGGDGNDKIMGMGGADQLTGGAGADQFRYLFTSDSGLGIAADRILDFTGGSDKLDFRALDANPALAGRQALSFIGTGAFATNGSAQVRYADSGSDTLVQIDLNGDGAADMQIVLVGHAGQALAGTDFLF
ncbi:MAG: putative Ig domain-containing protein [Novosphingobium sp.]